MKREDATTAAQKCQGHGEIQWVWTGNTGTGRGKQFEEINFMINVCEGMLMIEILVTPQF